MGKKHLISNLFFLFFSLFSFYFLNHAFGGIRGESDMFHVRFLLTGNGLSKSIFFFLSFPSCYDTLCVHDYEFLEVVLFPFLFFLYVRWLRAKVLGFSYFSSLYLMGLFFFSLNIETL